MDTKEGEKRKKRKINKIFSKPARTGSVYTLPLFAQFREPYPKSKTLKTRNERIERDGKRNMEYIKIYKL